jgi:hypothetical protein
MSLQSQFDGFGAANGQRQTGQLADVPTQAEARQCAIPTRRYPAEPLAIASNGESDLVL